MNCKEKYGLAPKQILSIYEGRCCNKARYLLEMRKDAWEEEKVLICGDESSFCNNSNPLYKYFHQFNKHQIIIQNINQIKKEI